jgi:hypothetical protein
MLIPLVLVARNGENHRTAIDSQIVTLLYLVLLDERRKVL